MSDNPSIGPDALERLYQRFGGSVLRRAARILGDPQRARDVCQDVFVQVLRSDKWPPPSPVAWLYATTTNLCLNLLRTDRRRRWALLWARTLIPPDPVRTDILKGAPWAFTVLAKAKGKQEVTRILSGARLSPGDHLRFEVSTSWPVGYAAIVSLDSAGIVSLLAPSTGPAVEIRRGGPLLLNDAVELDETTGAERIDLLGCPQPVAVTTLAAAARQALARERGNLRAVGRIAPACHQETVWIEKVNP